MDKKKILIVDDHPMIRSLMTALVTEDENLDVCAEVGGVREALMAAQEHQPDAAIVDISLDDGNGVDLLKKLLRQYPDIKILVCSTHDEVVFAPRALDAGALGYVSKKAEHSDIVAALKTVLQGNTWVSDVVAERLEQIQEPGHATGIDSLSNRELEVLRLIGEGKTPSKIAEQLFLSVKTVDAHREKIKRKLGMDTAAELLRYAVQWSLEEQ